MSHNIFEDGLGYEGKVTLTLKSNDRVLESRIYKNNGTAQLFKFLGYCLIGHYADVEHLLPTKIALLYNRSETLANAIPSNVEARSNFIGISQTPSIISTDSPAEVKVTYSFEVPRSSIAGDFNQIALYGSSNTNINSDIGNFSAYYYLTDSSRNVFEMQDISLWSTTTVLLVEWELSLSNKNIETSDN